MQKASSSAVAQEAIGVSFNSAKFPDTHSQQLATRHLEMGNLDVTLIQCEI
jgi:hypothetical protein